MKYNYQALFALLITSILLGGCCAFVKCDCYISGIYISYVDSTQQCQGLYETDISIEAYSVAGDVLQSNDESRNYGFEQGCTIFLFPSIEYYYVIHSDSVGINDTLRVQNLEITDRKQGCCNCGPRIRTIEYEINGQKFTETDANRSY